MKYDLLIQTGRSSVPSQNTNVHQAECAQMLPSKSQTEKASKSLSIRIRRFTLPSRRAQTCLGVIKVAVASLGSPTILCAIGNITSFSLPVFGTFTFESVAAVVELALSSARAIIGTQIETADTREKRFVSNKTDSQANPLLNNHRTKAVC